MAKSFQSVLYSYFLGPRLPFPIVLRAVQNAWAKFGLKDAMVNDLGYFFFRFNDNGGCNQVAESSPLMIRGRPLFVSTWDPSKGLTKPEHTSFPLWIKFYNIPLVAFNREGISRIASAVGVPLRLDACTASTCDKAWGRTNFAKVLVDVWAVGEIQKQIEVVIPRLSGDGEDVIKIVMEYDWVPSQCSKCKVFGHNLNSCLKVGIQKQKEIVKPLHTDGFIEKKRKQWKPKQSSGSSNGVQPTSSGEPSNFHEAIVGVGTIKPVSDEPSILGENRKDEEVVQSVDPDFSDGQRKETDESQYCMVDAGRMPRGREDVSNVTFRSKAGPELVKAVIQAMKPRRGAVSSTSTSNRFSPLPSDDSSDDDDMEIIDTEGHSLVLMP
ncbi:uncharacterized protein LOC112504774 [Cynara cardunculus var. scolymus]|uniref:uncharacterized protein LOC112504774 n=1 Tax=Cynara cardunculus var. scolymus TaxID=59895 RepID=UPI000D628B01|nr:uncharacterized protein LOC112504774 [Cynara cardunculus var. scolymus]